jgi:peptide/nickel transport system substrate-binding protein
MAPATLADAAGEVAFSADKAEALSTDTTTVEWLNLIGGESLGIVEKYLDQALADTFIPYPNVLGDLISAEDATARYENLKAFYAERGHFWAGNGPYILDDVFLTEQVATVVYNPMYPYDSDRWAAFAAPKLAEVEVEGEGSVVLGTDFVFDVTVTFEGEAYPDADITRVFGLVYDGTGALVAEVDAELVEDGMYTVTVPADVSAEMEAGASKVEVVVVPTVVATPTFVAFEFVAVE